MAIINAKSTAKMGFSALLTKEYILIFVLLLAYWLQRLLGTTKGEGAGRKL